MFRVATDLGGDHVLIEARGAGQHNVDQQCATYVVGVVPGFVLDAVVEDQALTFTPRPSLVRDAQPAPIGDNQSLSGVANGDCCCLIQFDMV